jgi:hypothetical protein
MNDTDHDMISLINNELSLQLPESLSMDELKEQLTQYINQLINTDFEKLIFYLYRIDVHEEKMKQLLQKQEGENAAALIAQLIIDRQLQKIKSRAEFKSGSSDEDAAERW